MKCYPSARPYGCDITLLETVAIEFNARLIAVGSIALEDIAQEKRGWRDGYTECIFLLENVESVRAIPTIVQSIFFEMNRRLRLDIVPERNEEKL